MIDRLHMDIGTLYWLVRVASVGSTQLCSPLQPLLLRRKLSYWCRAWCQCRCRYRQTLYILLLTAPLEGPTLRPGRPRQRLVTTPRRPTTPAENTMHQPRRLPHLPLPLLPLPPRRRFVRRRPPMPNHNPNPNPNHSPNLRSPSSWSVTHTAKYPIAGCQLHTDHNAHQRHKCMWLSSKTKLGGSSKLPPDDICLCFYYQWYNIHRARQLPGVCCTTGSRNRDGWRRAATRRAARVGFGTRTCTCGVGRRCGRCAVGSRRWGTWPCSDRP